MCFRRYYLAGVSSLMASLFSVVAFADNLVRPDPSIAPAEVVAIQLMSLKNNDLVEVADALGDMLYILCGTILSHGMQHKIEEVFDEIQRSNMSKLGEDGEPIYREDGKVMKGPNYFKPNISDILKR